MTISKVAPSSIRPAAQQSAPVKQQAAQATQSAQQATKAGWGTGAAAGAPLKITLATIDEGPKTSATIKAPKGFKAELQTSSERLTDKVAGKAVSYEHDVSNLTLTGPGGKKVAIWKEDSSNFSSDWKEEVAATKKDKASQEWMQLDWSYGRNLSSVGTAGKMISLQENSNDYMGGAHPNHATRTGTFDASTGKQVKLEDLLSQKQMTALVNDISKRFETMKGPEDVGPEAFSFDGDKAALRDTINTNFALIADKNGKVKIDITWDSGIHALGGLLAHVQVDAPSDPAFRARLGLE